VPSGFLQIHRTMSSPLDLSKCPFKEERKDLVFLAKAAETAERFDDMCVIVKRLAVDTAKQHESDLTEEERNLLSVAYKNAIGSRRAAWRSLRAEEYKGNELIQFYEGVIEPEFNGLCNDVLELLTKNLLPSAITNVSKTFYYKMAGDYSRYQAEFRPDGEFGAAAKKYYTSAWETAVDLPTTHPIRLGLALNFSVCYFEVLKEPEQAITVARQAFDDGIAHLHTLDENDYKDATAILQLIRDNLTLWGQSGHEGHESHEGHDGSGHDGQHEVAVGHEESAAAPAAADGAGAVHADGAAPAAATEEPPKTEEPAAAAQ